MAKHRRPSLRAPLRALAGFVAVAGVVGVSLGVFSNPERSTAAIAMPEAHVGSTLVLRNNGADATVTLVQLTDPSSSPTGSRTGSPAGQRLVSAEFSFANTGTIAVKPSINTDATLIGADGQTYRPDDYASNGCQSFNRITNVAPEQAATGCDVYPVPKGVRIAIVDFAFVVPAIVDADPGKAGLGRWQVP